MLVFLNSVTVMERYSLIQSHQRLKYRITGVITRRSKIEYNLDVYNLDEE